MENGIKLKVSPCTYLVWTVLLLLGQTQFLLCSFVSAVLHECAHISAYYFFGAKVSQIIILPFGLSATINKTEKLSCSDEVICAFCGPFMNLILAVSVFLLSGRFFIGTEVFIICNLSFFVLNLLPVIPLDGGRIVYFLLLKFLPVRKSNIILRVTGLIFSLLLLCMGLFIFIVSGYNVSVLLIGCYLLIYLLTSLHGF